MKVIQTRKHEALCVLRYVVISALLLLLLGSYHFLPDQAIRENEQVFSLPETEIIHSETVALTPLHFYRVTLSRVEDTLLLTPARLTLLRGWQRDALWSRTVKPEEADVPLLTWSKTHGNRGAQLLFGFVPADEPIPTFLLEHYSDEWDITTQYWSVAFREELTPEILMETEEGFYYVCSCIYDAPAGNRGRTEISRINEDGTK